MEDERQIYPYSLSQELEARSLAINYLKSVATLALEITETEWDTGLSEWEALTDEERLPYVHELHDMLIELEERIADPDWGRELSREASVSFHDAVGRYHHALPFSEAERDWLTKTYAEIDESPAGGDVSGNVAVLASTEAEIRDRGLLVRVSGQELTTRWWDWVRGTGRYEGQGAHAQAMEALHDVAYLVAGDAPGA